MNPKPKPKPKADVHCQAGRGLTAKRTTLCPPRSGLCMQFIHIPEKKTQGRLGFRVFRFQDLLSSDQLGSRLKLKDFKVLGFRF